MALIDLKHAITPFQNKVHLGTVILVGVGFFFFRLAGGSLSVKDASAPSKVETPEINTMIPAPDRKTRPGSLSLKPLKEQPPIKIQKQPDSLESLFGIKEKNGDDAQPPGSAERKQQPAGKAKDLSDIESMLGM